MAEDKKEDDFTSKVLEGFEPAERANYGVADQVDSSVDDDAPVQKPGNIISRIARISTMTLVAIVIVAASIMFATINVARSYGTMNKKAVQERLEKDDEERAKEAKTTAVRSESKTTGNTGTHATYNEDNDDEDDDQTAEKSEPMRLGSDSSSQEDASSSSKRIRVIGGAVDVADESDLLSISGDDVYDVTKIKIDNLSAQGFPTLRKFDNLQDLTIANLSGTDFDFNVFMNVSNLKYLTIGNFTGSNLDVTGLPSLDTLDVTIGSNVQAIDARSMANLKRVFVRGLGSGAQPGTVGSLMLSNASTLRDITVTCSVGEMDIQYDENLMLISYTNSMGNDGVIGKVIYDSLTDEIAIQNLQDKVNDSGATGWSFEHRGV